MLGKSAYFFVVLWHGGSCQGMCGMILWVGKQNDSTTPQSINSMHWRPWFQRRRRSEFLGRIVTSMLSNGSIMFMLGTNWKTCCSMVSEQSCTIDHKMDQSMWQTIISIDLLHSSHMWIQTILSCGKHCQTMQVGTVSRLRFKMYIRWNIVHFRKPYICSNQLDVQETNFSFAQFNRIRNHCLGCRIEVGRKTRTWFMGSDRCSSSRKHVSD